MGFLVYTLTFWLDRPGEWCYRKAEPSFLDRRATGLKGIKIMSNQPAYTNVTYDRIRSVPALLPSTFGKKVIHSDLTRLAPVYNLHIVHQGLIWPFWTTLPKPRLSSWVTHPHSLKWGPFGCATTCHIFHFQPPSPCLPHFNMSLPLWAPCLLQPPTLHQTLIAFFFFLVLFIPH